MPFDDTDREVYRLLRETRELAGVGANFTDTDLRAACLHDPGTYSPDTAIAAVERAESKVAAGVSQLRIDIDSGRLYAPGYEVEQRSRLLGEWGTEVSAWSDNLRDHVSLVTRAIGVVDAQLENPRTTWSTSKVAEAEQHLAGVRRALAAYPTLVELEGQLTAAQHSGKDALLDAWREGLLERAANGQGDALGAEWLERLSKALATDPALVRVRSALTTRLEKYQAAQRKIDDLTRPRRVEVERQAWREKYGYGAGDGPATFWNEGDGPRPRAEMRELEDDVPAVRAGRRR